jgi:hypothetical protein
VNKSNKSKEILRLEQVVSEILGEKKTYDDRTANGLTVCIIDFIQIIKRQQAERFHSSGIPFIDPKTGNQKYAKPITTTGTADIHATIKGKSVKIEVKIGSDKQSQAQKEYQRSIERADGVYYVAKSFASFSWWYLKKFER